MANFYIFSRDLSAPKPSGDRTWQQLTVYADNIAEARRLVAYDLRMQAGRGSELMTAPTPPFEVKELPLDAPQVLTSVFSTK